MSLRPPTPSSSEKRRAPRQKVLLGAKIVARDGVSFDCVVADLSPVGARLRSAADRLWPSEFYLVEVSNGMAHFCDITWRRMPWVGVALRRSWDLRRSRPARLEHVRQLWLELAPRDCDREPATSRGGSSTIHSIDS